MTVSDWMIIAATLCGPILAVQAQKAIEAARESRGQKSWVFHQLMATRAARVSPQHVQALNTIDLTFYGRRRFRGRSEQEQAVLDRWKEYHDLLSDHGERERGTLPPGTRKETNYSSTFWRQSPRTLATSSTACSCVKACIRPRLTTYWNPSIINFGGW